MMPDLPFDDTAIPIWEQLDAIGRSAPVGAWDAVHLWKEPMPAVVRAYLEDGDETIRAAARVTTNIQHNALLTKMLEAA